MLTKLSIWSCLETRIQNEVTIQRLIVVPFKGWKSANICENLTYQNSIREEIGSRWNSGNACYCSVQNLLPSSLLSKNIKITIYRTIILPVVLCGCETCSLTFREERRLRVFENRVLRENIWASKGRGNRGTEKTT